ncbi:hypothetical protein AAMO2058_001623500, partial [Amorphochlora amoebiformis]
MTPRPRRSDGSCLVEFAKRNNWYNTSPLRTGKKELVLYFGQTDVTLSDVTLKIYPRSQHVTLNQTCRDRTPGNPSLRRISTKSPLACPRAISSGRPQVQEVAPMLASPSPIRRSRSSTSLPLLFLIAAVCCLVVGMSPSSGRLASSVKIAAPSLVTRPAGRAVGGNAGRASGWVARSTIDKFKTMVDRVPVSWQTVVPDIVLKGGEKVQGFYRGIEDLDDLMNGLGDVSHMSSNGVKALNFIEKDMDLVGKRITGIFNQDHPILRSVTEYFFKAGGKRIRPVMTLIMARAILAHQEALENGASKNQKIKTDFDTHTMPTQV